MSRPAWVTVVGVLGIILAGFGFLGAVQTMAMPTVLEFQEEIMSGVQKELQEQGEASEEVLDMFAGMFDVPEWFNAWSMAAGVIGLLVSGFYLFASISLLQMKRSAPKVFYSAAGICVIFALIKSIVAVSAMSLMGAAIMFWSLLGMVVNIILLIVAATSDKSAFIPVESRLGHPGQ
ncbi:hypothetical protein BMS3Abin10_01182 [bacterium BMS3Abin10]|nr:hypothetical protein BMS3Abin10_01182 [bacterium BMS3Abin10]GBE38665.1 hypothetical protein BMS3Bbin08_01273 [bacterium BMS3Bbin08]HDH50574.1 hypothetical protein [Nitrospirota bacterium]HDK41717.1 hypothetical protein [Nitrospirota bacterium]